MGGWFAPPLSVSFDGSSLGAKPLQDRTGSGGYLGKRESSSDSPQRRKLEPRVVRTRRTQRQLAQSPAGVVAVIAADPS